MQCKPLFFAATVATAFLFASCGSTDKSGIAVPKDAAIVVHLNSPSLSSKLSWQEIKQTRWFSEFSADADDSLAKQLMNDPGSSGINTEQEMVFFMKRLANKGGYMAFTGTLSDAGAFEAFNKKLSAGATASKVGDISVMKTPKGIATWMDTRFVYIIDAPYMALPNKMGAPGGDPESEPLLTPLPGLPTDSLVHLAKELYELKGDASLSSDKRYASLLKEPGDVHFWLSAGNLYQGMLSAMPLGNLNALVNGNITAASLNFDDGKITANSKSYYNEELRKIYEQHKMKNLDADALNRLPSQDIVAAFAMNYPPEALKEILKLVGVDGLINGFLTQQGYSVDEFVKANKGDVIIAVTDFKAGVATPPSPEMPVNMPPKPDAKFLLAASVNDKPAFDKMIGIVKEKMGFLAASEPGLAYSINDKWFVFGNSQEQVNQFASGNGGAKPAFVGRISGHPMGGYVDLQRIFRAVEAGSADSTARIALTESAKLWEDVVFYGGELKDGAVISHLEVNLVDKKTNSLKQLNQYFDKLPHHQKGF